MSDDNSSIMSHISIGTNDFERAIVFYYAVLATAGAKRVVEHPGAVANGRQYPKFSVQSPMDGIAATTGNETPSSYGEPYYGCFVYDPDGHKIEVNF